MNSPLISVIVPVYNTEKYLDQCIQSVLTQTYTNWELLLIDDGSTDSSGAICDRYAEQDPRIHVFHKENGGVSSARNLGLDSAKGDWMTFIDADDSVKPKYLNNLLSHVDSDIDLVFSYAEFHYSNREKRRESYPERLITNKDFHIAFTEHELNWHTSPWSKLYKAELCNDLRFTLGMPIGEDLVFLYSYLLKCNKIFFSSDTDYCYTVDIQTSLTKRAHNVEVEYFVYSQVTLALKNLIKEKNITHPVAINKTNWIIASYTRRVLNSLYISNISKMGRITYIKKLDIPTYIKHIGNTSVYESFYIYLLKLKSYTLYDCIRMLIARIKTMRARGYVHQKNDIQY